MSAGHLYAVVGPSGAGKDTLMQLAARQRPDLYVVRRVITRPETAGGEDFEGVTQAAFDARRARGEFALVWEAHGLSYGIPASIAAVLAAGNDAMMNGSRAGLTEAQAAFPTLVVLHVTARPEVLAERLLARGRETAADVAKRLARAAMPLPGGLRHVIEIDNSGDISTGVRALLDALDPAALPAKVQTTGQ